MGTASRMPIQEDQVPLRGRGPDLFCRLLVNVLAVLGVRPLVVRGLTPFGFLFLALFLALSAPAYADDGVINAPQTYEEALVGTGKRMLPRPGGLVVDAGTADAIRGLDNLVGPFLGAAPDAGAYELGLGLPWTGPRSFANLLAYGLPQGWRVAPPTELPGYASLGAPNSVAANAFRLLLVTSDPQKPPAFILITFEPLLDEPRWSRFDEILRGEAGDTLLAGPLQFRDGLGLSVVERGANAQLLGARVDDEGVLKISGGVAKGSLNQSVTLNDIPQTIQDDWATVVRSLTYAWYLQDVSNPIFLAFVTPPTPGMIPVGAPAAPSTGNTVVPGTLHGDVTITNASIIWDVEGDDDLDATATVDFRRLGTTAWRPALNLFRVKAKYYETDPLRNRVVGSIFGLSPAATYEVKVTLADPDNGGVVETRTTTLTTRQVPKPGGGRTIEIRDTDDLDAVTASALPGDTFLLHAGSYTTKSYGDLWYITKSGTQEQPILFRAYGDGAVNFQKIGTGASHLWLDGLALTLPNLGYGIYTFPLNNVMTTNIAVTRTTVRDAGAAMWFAGTDNTFVSDNTVKGVGRKPSTNPILRYDSDSQGIDVHFRTHSHVISFNEVTDTWEGVGSGGDRNSDVHNNHIHGVADDDIEFDFGYNDLRAYDNLTHDGGNHNTSFQPMVGGPWFFFRNQFTGAWQTLKLRSFGNIVIVGNTFVSAAHMASAHFAFAAGSLWGNNYQKALSPEGGAEDKLGELPYMDAIDVSAVRLWGYNRYHAQWCWPWNNGTLQYVQSYGAEIRTILVNDPDGRLAAGCGSGGGGGGNQAPTANGQNVVVRQNRSVAIQLSGSDPNGDKLTFAIGQNPSNGSLSTLDSSTGKVTYTPNPDFVGSDSFTFTVKDGTLVSAPATISIKVIIPSPEPKDAKIHLKLDETSGVTASDASGNNNHGTLMNSPAWVAGKLAGALQFDGVDDYVEHPDSASLDMAGDMTISLWAKISALTANSGAFVTKSQNGKQGNAAPNAAYAFGISYASVAFTLSDGQTHASVSGPKGTIDDNTWHHLVALRDGATLKIYKDGAQLYTATIDSAFSIQDTPFTLRMNADGAYDAQRFTGLMDDVRIFNRALTEGEILTLASEETAFCMDANGDGKANLQDILLMVQMLVGKIPTPSNFCHLDLNKDGAFNVADPIKGIRHVLDGTEPTCNCGG